MLKQPEEPDYELVTVVPLPAAFDVGIKRQKTGKGSAADCIVVFRFVLRLGECYI